MNYRLPNFLIVGASKSGTTSLWNHLRQHPSIFMSIPKEPRFFLADLVKNLSRLDPRFNNVQRGTVMTFELYCKIFDNIPENITAIGEATVQYLYYYEEAITNIHQSISNPKIVIILRNPADRAFSAYKHLFSEFWENASFERCLELEEERKNWEILNLFKSAGLYYEQVKAYLDNFDKVQIYLYDDMEKDSIGLVKNVYKFLDVDENFIPDTRVKANVSRSYKSLTLGRFLRNYDHPLKKVLRPLLLYAIGEKTLNKFMGYLYVNNKSNSKITLKMKPETRKELIDFFREDVLKLQDLIGRDLTHWLKY